MKVTLTSKGRVVLPAAIRRKDRLQRGDQFAVERVAAGEYKLVRIRSSNDGLVDLLLACPAKDFFVPIESEMTSSVQSSRGLLR
jgi:AbrB family looped-hinge helix DNA binding protein